MPLTTSTLFYIYSGIPLDTASHQDEHGVRKGLFECIQGLNHIWFAGNDHENNFMASDNRWEHLAHPFVVMNWKWREIVFYSDVAPW